MSNEDGNSANVALALIVAAIGAIGLGSTFVNEARHAAPDKHNDAKPASLNQLVSMRIDRTTEMTGGLVKSDKRFTKRGEEVHFKITLGTCVRRGRVLVRPKSTALTHIGPVNVQLADKSNWVPVTSKQRLLKAVEASADRRCLR